MRVFGINLNKSNHINNNKQNSALKLKYEADSFTPSFKGLGEIDATKIDNPTRITPGYSYLVGKDACIALYKYNLDFQNPIIEKRLEHLDKGKSIIFGRNEVCLPGMNEYVSSKHLKVTKRESGSYIVTDLYSTNGTTILPAKKYSRYENGYCANNIPRKLNANEAKELPMGCQLVLSDEVIIDTRDPKLRKLLYEKGSVKIGRSENCDIQIDNFLKKVSGEHLQIWEESGRLFAKDLKSTNGTILVPKEHIQPFYFGAENIELQQGNVGDCYLLAAIYALSKNPSGAKLLEDMVSIDNDGNYLIRFYDGSRYKVCLDELDGDEIDNEKICSVTALPEIKAIERAYGRKIKTDGIGSTFQALDEGGKTADAIFKLTGLRTNSYTLEDTSSTKNILRDAAKSLKEHSCILSCSSKYSRIRNYADLLGRFPTRHAYIISDINTDNETITITNPHDTKKPTTISWNQFSRYFREIHKTSI